MICIESIVSGNNNLVLTTEAQFYQILEFPNLTEFIKSATD